MHCATCPFHRRTLCQAEGCYAARGLVAHDLALQPVAEAIDRQLTRLDVEGGDILVLRTRHKLRPELAAEWQEELKALCRSQGVRDVSVVVLDNCTSLTVERRSVPDTRMQYQPVKGAPIVSY